MEDVEVEGRREGEEEVVVGSCEWSLSKRRWIGVVTLWWDWGFGTNTDQ